MKTPQKLFSRLAKTNRVTRRWRYIVAVLTCFITIIAMYEPVLSAAANDIDTAVIKTEATTETETTAETETEAETTAETETEAEIESSYAAASGQISYKGDDYEITLSYETDANIPADASLRVVEYGSDSAAYAKAKEALLDYKRKTCADLNADRFGVALLDISIIDKDGNEIEPESSVGVNIVMKSLPENVPAELFSETAEMHHFVEKENGFDIVTSMK